MSETLSYISYAVITCREQDFPVDININEIWTN
jgi:hypothetical protein